MADTAVLSWIVNDERVDLDLLDVTGVEWRAAREATGIRQGELVPLALEHKDPEAMAALLWIALHRVDPTVAYDEVLAAVTIRTCRADG